MTGLLVGAMVVAACGSDEPAATTSAPALGGSSWTLASVTAAGQDEAAATTATAALDFNGDGTALNGSTGCNQFAGTYTQDGSQLTITLGPVTRVACDAILTAQETAVLAGLPKVASFTADGQLVLQDSSGATLLTYDKGLSSLEGTSWQATGVNNGTGGVESTALTEQLTAVFGTQGALTGSGGCNNFTAKYTLSGSDGLAITGIASTKKACADDVNQLETQYFAALERVATYQISGNKLNLRDDQGATQVDYQLAT